MGRPREFDVDAALQAAMELFWRKGYEGTSLSDLTDGMGITRPSLYGTFGNKEELFRKALERYHRTHMGFVAEALGQPTARAVVERLLTGFADAQTQAPNPCGCLGVNAALACSDDAADVQKALIDWRRASERALAVRLAEAETAGELPEGSKAEDLARYVMTVAQGMAVQAAAGADRAALHRVIEMTLRALPG